MSDPTVPNDQQLNIIARGDPYLLISLRRLFEQTGTLSPDLINDAVLAAGNAEQSANQANASIERLAEAVELLALRPENVDRIDDDNLSPANNNGTIASQNSDNVDITGGDVTGLDNLEADGAIFGDPGTEGSGISIHGVTYDSVAKVSDIGGTNQAEFILHRHSTTLPPVIVSARSHSDTSSHTIVQDGDILFGIFGAGWSGSYYDLGASITFDVDGTPGADDMPGRIVFGTTPSGGFIPLEAMRISQDQIVTLANSLPLTSGGTGSSTLTAAEVSQIENIGTTTISGTQWGYVGAFNQGLTTTSNVNFGTLTTSGAVAVNATTQSTSPLTGSIQTDGGLGVVKNLHVGGIVTINVDDTGISANASSKLILEDATGANLLEFISPTAHASVQGIYFSDNATGRGRLQYTHSTNTMEFYTNAVLRLSIAGTAITATKRIAVSDTTESASTGTGSIQTAGGAGIVKNLHVGGETFLNLPTSAGTTGSLWDNSGVVEVSP